MIPRWQLAAAAAIVAGAGSCASPGAGPGASRSAAPPADVDWRVTGGAPSQTRFSPLDQIDRANVKSLRVAWIYHTGDASSADHTEIQASPIVVHGVLYSTSPGLALFALRAATGEQLWRFDPFVGRERERHVNRGVAYWEEGTERRLFYVVGRRLYAIDATTGRPAPGFGCVGWGDLAEGLDRYGSRTQLVATSPGVVYRDLLIQGTRVGEGAGSAPGNLRAFDVRTGRVRWIFHTIPRTGEPGAETWAPEAWRTAGGANSWPGLTLDTARGIVFVPTGSATPDFYGGERLGANLYANTLLALDAATGRRLWHFQTVHHDVWDRDLPAAPNLLRVTRDGRQVDAVAQITKSGFVFLFDRETGRPLFPVEERPVPQSDLKGEETWPTQPIPTKPAPFARQVMTEADVSDLTPEAHAAALARFRTLRSGHLFLPPSEAGTVVLPGFDGGGEWGGAAVDERSGVIFVNGSDVPWIAALKESTHASAPSQTGEQIYVANCSACHHADLRGDGGRAPSLVGVTQRITIDQIRAIIERGRNFMPAFPGLTEAQKNALIAYLGGRNVTVSAAAPSTARSDDPNASGRATSRYQFSGYERWRDAEGYPAIKPPWGTLSAIDLNTGEYRWRITLGEHAALTARGVPPTGTEQYGGPIVTAGGLVFIAATMDGKFRAFDEDTGALLWEHQLPVPGYATPSTYRVGGRQYVVIAAGGGKLGSASGDSYVAFALRE
jgi:quinoprotein glucose dehydrogenase